MNSYIKMRKRFASAFSDLVDYQVDDISPRRLKISSLLLVESAEMVLGDLVKIADSRQIIASEKIIPKDFSDRVQETISYGIMGIVNFFVAYKKSKEEVTPQDKALFDVVVNAIIKFLKHIDKVTQTDRKVEQVDDKGRDRLYYLLQDDKLSESVNLFLVGLEDKRIVKILQDLGRSDDAKAIKNLITKIERNLNVVEDANERQNVGVPNFDASKPYRFIAASEGFVA